MRDNTKGSNHMTFRDDFTFQTSNLNVLTEFKGLIFTINTIITLITEPITTTERSQASRAIQTAGMDTNLFALLSHLHSSLVLVNVL